MIFDRLSSSLAQNTRTKLISSAIGIRRISCFLILIVFLLSPTDGHGQQISKAYVSDFNFINVVDLGRNQVINRIFIPGGGNDGIAASPDGTRIYVGHASRLTVIDTQTDRIVSTFVIGRNIVTNRGVAINRSGTRVYTTHFQDRTLSVLDTISNSITTINIPGACCPGGVAVDPAGTRVYVAIGGDGISVVDATANSVIDTISLDEFRSLTNVPWALAVSATGTQLFATTPFHSISGPSIPEHSFVNINVLTKQIVGAVPGLGVGGFTAHQAAVAIHPTLPLAYVAGNLNGTLSVINTTSNSVLTTIFLGQEPQAITVDQAGEKIYVTSQVSGGGPFASGKLTVLDTSSNSVLSSIPLPSPFLKGVAVVPGDACAMPTIPLPAPQTISGRNGNEWRMDVEVSSQDGLVIRDVRLRNRFMAREISVPYFMIETSALANSRAELKPNGIETTARSRLVKFNVTVDSDPMVVEATYLIDRIPASSGSCLEITQRYEFYATATGCEPTEHLPCARFNPIVKYKFQGRSGETLRAINVAQRLHFQVDQKPLNSAAIFRDCNLSPFPPTFGCLLTGGGVIFERKRNPLLFESNFRVIGNGLDFQSWDNYHQSPGKNIAEPGIQFLADPPFLVEAKPGCPECVHIHWRWGANVPNSQAFGGGLPLIPPGSNQDVDVAVVRYRVGEEHPNQYTDLLNPLEPIRTVIDPPRLFPPEEVVFWYSATGHKEKDEFFIHGGFFNPSTPNVNVRSGPVSVTYAHLFEDGPTTVSAIDPATLGRLPTGYFVFDNLAFDIDTDAVVSGPHTVSFTIPRIEDSGLFSRLRILHGETDPDNPGQTIFVDRTILSPDGPAPDFQAKMVSARVDSLSPFVVAFINRPPNIKCRDLETVVAESCTVRIGPNDVNDGSFDPDGDSFTLSLDIAGPLSPGVHTANLVATDHLGSSSSCLATIKVFDMTPPTITLRTGQQMEFWPPNHQSETVRVSDFVASASDNCGGSLTNSVVIASISSDEPDDAPGGGDGNTTNDIVIAANCKTAQLRAERQGGGNGRVYRITFKVKDVAGNVTTVTAKVGVPKSQGNNNGAVVDAPAHTVNGTCP